MRIIVLLGMLLALCLPVQAEPQHTRKSTEFFPKNFVVRRAGKETATRANTAEPIPRKPGVPNVSRSGVSQPSGSGTSQDTPGDETTALPETEELASDPIPITRIGAIWNSEDKEKLPELLGELNVAITEKNIRPGIIYLVGQAIDPTEYFDSGNLFGPLFAAGGVPLSVPKVPPKYPVTSSPTWIIETEQGSILLEGVYSLSRYVNASGEFVDRRLRP